MYSLNGTNVIHNKSTSRRALNTIAMNIVTKKITSFSATSVYPYTYKWLNITPDFYRKGVEGTIDLKGKLRLASIIFPALRILLSRDFKRTMKLAKKI